MPLPSPTHSTSSPALTEQCELPDLPRFRRLIDLTVLRNPWIPHEPSAKQALFLAYEGREAMYGGAGGGGKTDALLMGALQYADIPGYSALILMPSYQDLKLPKAGISRSREWLGGTGATWHGDSYTWSFPKGSTLTFGYLANEGDEHRYRTAEFQYVAFDELTRFTETQYRFLFSRLRRLKSSGVPVRMRSATNPGGKGHAWVRKRFISDEFMRLRTEEKFTRPWWQEDRLFVPARLADNPHIDRADYELSLERLDPVSRAQIKLGDWSDFSGGRFRREWFRYYRRAGSRWQLGSDQSRLTDIIEVYITVDPAASTKTTSKDDPDYTVISTWGRTTSGDLLWLGCWRGRVEVPDIIPALQAEAKKWKAQRVVIEAGGMQKGVYQLAARVQPRMNVIPFNPLGKQGSTPRFGNDKLVRATDFINMMAAGRVWLPEDQPMFPLEEVQAELLAFTGDDKLDAHDDIVDTGSMAAIVFAGPAVGGAPHFFGDPHGKPGIANPGIVTGGQKW